jgi:hypothetical protein
LKDQATDSSCFNYRNQLIAEVTCVVHLGIFPVYGKYKGSRCNIPLDDKYGTSWELSSLEDKHISSSELRQQL